MRIARPKAKPGQRGREVMSRKAEAFAAAAAPTVLALRAEGHSLRQIAAELAERGLKTPRGCRWTANAVRRVLLRVTPAAG